MVFPVAASRTPHWYTKVLTVLSELDAATAAASPDGKAGRHHKVDRRVNSRQLELTPNLVNLANRPLRTGLESRADGRRGRCRPRQFRLPEFRRSCRKEEPSQDPRHSAPHQQGIHLCSLSLPTWTSKFFPTNRFRMLSMGDGSPINRNFVFSSQQIFTYPTISSMSGVISPTNLSLFSSPVSVTRPVATQRSVSNVPPRWNTAPFINLEDDYNMIAPIITGTASEPPSTMDEGQYQLTHSSTACGQHRFSGQVTKYKYY